MYNEQKYIGKRCDRDDGRQLAKHESAGQDGRWWLVCVRCGRGGRLGRGDAGGRLGSIMSNEPNSTHHGGTEGTETGANAIPEKHQGQCSVLLCRNNWKFFPDNLEMVMQVRVAERVRPRAEAQRRWDGKGVAVLLFSASQRLCARTYWFRPQAALGALWLRGTEVSNEPNLGGRPAIGDCGLQMLGVAAPNEANRGGRPAIADFGLQALGGRCRTKPICEAARGERRPESFLYKRSQSARRRGRGVAGGPFVRTKPICQAASGGRRPRRGFCTNEANRGERDACDWGFRTLRVAVSNEPNLRGGVGAEWTEGLLCKRSQFWRAWRGSGARAGTSARRGRCAGARGFPPGPGWVPCGRWWAGGCRRPAVGRRFWKL